MKKILISISALLVLFLLGCGGGGGSSPDTTETQTPKTIAIDKIMLYADDNTQPVPTVDDYADAGVVGVTLDNIDDVNDAVADLTASDVDTTEEIQQIAHDLGILILPTADAGPDKSVEVDQAVTITGSGTDIDGMIVSYEWKKGNTVLANSASFDYIPTVVGTDTLTLTVMDDDGGTASDEMNVTVTAVPPNILPVADAGTDESVEVGQTITITGTGTDSDGMIVSYEWKKGNTVLANSASFDYIPTVVGTDTLTLTVMDDDGGTASDEMNVTVTAVPPNILPVADAGTDESVEVGQTITITGTGTDSDGMIVSYEWKKGNTVLANSASFDYIPTVVGTDTLTLTVMDDDGGTASDEMNVTVTAVPPVSFVSDVMPIFAGNCQTCHSASTNRTFKIGDAAYTYNNIITNSLIDTASPDSSLILLKGNAEIGHNGGDKLSDDNSKIVRDWIVEGGLNN